MNKCILFIITVMIALFIGVQTNANSGPIEIEAYSSSEIVPIVDEDIHIASEVLTFDFSKEEGFNLGIGQGEQNVSAAYVMHNQSATKTVMMAFPYIESVQYATDNKAQIVANNEEIIPTIYYGTSTSSIALDTLTFEDIMSHVYPKEFYFDEDDVGTLVRFKLPLDGLNARISVSESTKMIYENMYISQYHSNSEHTFKSNYYSSNLEYAYIYFIGEDYDITSNSAEVIFTELSINDYLSQVSTKNNITNEDYLQLMINLMQEVIESDIASINHSFLVYGLYDMRLVLLVYEVELIGDYFDNEVTVSFRIEGTINNRFNPAKRIYHYLTNPAKNWASFSNLTIKVKTSASNPYVIQSNVEFQKTGDYEYTYMADELPEDNLSFTICASKTPRAAINPYFLIAVIVIGGIVFLSVLAIIPIVMLIRVVEVVIREKKLMKNK